MKIAAIDFETATFDRSSACAIGGVFIDVDEQQNKWTVDPEPFYELIRPPGNEYYDFNIAIHGITPKMTVKEKPFDKVWSKFEERLDGHILIAHNTAFDMYVLRDSAQWYEYKPAEFDFLCTYRLAKETWPSFFSYRLDVLAQELDIELEHHHHAAYDALASALLAVKICEANGTGSLVEAAERHGFRLGRFSMEEYKPFSNARNFGGGGNIRSKDFGGGENIRFKDLVPTGEVDETHPMFGLSFAFTGTLKSMSRRDAAQRVVDVGGEAHAGPTKKTNFLVVGMTDFTKVRDGMSEKMRKAAGFAELATGIEIIDEQEFLQMFV